VKGSVRNRAIAAAIAAIAIVAAVVLATQGGGHKPAPAGTGPVIAGKPPSAPGTSTIPAQKAPPGRLGVRRGKNGAPDQPAPGTAALLGIGDQKPETFSDPLFRKLGVARSRLSTPWNSIFTEPGRLAAWLNAARADGVEPLVAFERGRGQLCPAQPCSAPPVAEYARAVRAFHARYPWVTLLQPWNEANSSTQPTGRMPERAAAYYGAVEQICPGCTVTGADLLDASNLDRWLARFRRGLGGRTPKLWGLHNYSDSNRFRNRGTRRLLELVPGEVWITEAGGIVSFTTADGRRALPYDEQRAARATRFLFRLAGAFPRITRIYVYQWKIDFPGNRFDAGLVGADGKPRPALSVITRKLALLR
jgi:hypothetical protein